MIQHDVTEKLLILQGKSRQSLLQHDQFLQNQRQSNDRPTVLPVKTISDQEIEPTNVCVCC